MHSRTAIYPSIGMISHLNAFGELAIFSLVLTHRALPPGVIPTHRYVKRLAEQADGILLPMVFDEVISHIWFCEKMATASDRILIFRENSCMRRSLLLGHCTCQYILLQKFPSHYASVPHSTLLNETLHRLLQRSLY